MWSPRLDGRKGPRYLAIVESIADDFASGELRQGTRLPTHRDLADALGVTVGTISRAYAEAARRGLISGEVGRGTFVRGPVPESTADEGEVCDLSQNHPPEPAARPQRAALIAALAAFLTLQYMQSRIGYALMALREDEEAAKSMGINTTKYKIIAFILSRPRRLAINEILLRPAGQQ
jgi:DNA-binding transcriptional MocR family regulator